jgi:hypothetical protein
MDGSRPDRPTQQAIASGNLGRFNFDMPITTANTAFIPRQLPQPELLLHTRSARPARKTSSLAPTAM